MSIEGFNQQLHALNDATAEYTRDVHAVLQDERFAALPAGMHRAAELAIELAAHLERVEQDAGTFAEALEPFAEGDRLDVIQAEAQELAQESGSEALESLPQIIYSDTVQLRVLIAHLNRAVGTMATYRTLATRISGRPKKDTALSGGTGGAAVKIERLIGHASAGVDKGAAKVNDIITEELRTLNRP